MVPEKSGNASSRRNRVENERAGGGFRFFFGSTSDRGKAISLLLVSLIKISVINFSTPRWPRAAIFPSRPWLIRRNWSVLFSSSPSSPSISDRRICPESPFIKLIADKASRESRRSPCLGHYLGQLPSENCVAAHSESEWIFFVCASKRENATRNRRRGSLLDCDISPTRISLEICRRASGAGGRRSQLVGPMIDGPARSGSINQNGPTVEPDSSISTRSRIL